MMKQLFQTQCPLPALLLLVYTITLLSACKQQSYASPDGYDLNHPQKENLGKVLNEISGITFNNNENTLLAISDSKQKVFEINLTKQKLEDYTNNIVPSKSDIEDIVMVDSSLYLLSSKGIIYEVPAKKKDSSPAKAYPFRLTAQNDFETLYYDAEANGLIMVCKHCPSDKGKNIRSAYRFNPASKQFDKAEFFTFNTQEIKKILNGDKAQFDPSAAAVHPITGQLYVLSSAGNLLVIADRRGKIIKAYHLNPEQFPQAEGIAFMPDGDMLISNEGKYGAATLQVFKYKNNNKK